MHRTVEKVYYALVFFTAEQLSHWRGSRRDFRLAGNGESLRPQFSLPNSPRLVSLRPLFFSSRKTTTTTNLY